MAIDKIEQMTLDTLPYATTPEEQVQLNLLKQLTLYPDSFRLAFFHMPADIRLHAKHSLISALQKDYEVQTLNIADFTQELITAIHNGTWIDLKHFEDAPVLICDDLQFIVGKDSTQKAFYASVLKPRLEKKRLLTVLFSEKGYTELSVIMRDDLRNLLKLGFHEDDI